MENSKETDLNGISETMLQTLYARAKESEKPKHKIYDQKAIETVKQLDYDFSAADKDVTMSTGVIARTILLDRMVSEWLTKHPDAVVINIASGMDTRFYRIDNQNIRSWYNIDPAVFYCILVSENKQSRSRAAMKIRGSSVEHS